MTATVPIVRIKDLTKRFVIRKEKSLKERVVNAGRSAKFKEEFWALRGINIEIESGATIGLIGSNGSGKSTLLKAIGGIIDPTEGSVERRGRLAALLELGAGFHPDLTGRENVYLNASILGLSREQTDGYFDDIVEFSGIADFIDTQVKFYSSGMYVRLAFAVAIHVDPDILLVDEVLAVGDEAFQRKCLDKIREFQSQGRTIILVTHSLSQVEELCDRAVLLHHGEVVFDGDPHTATTKFRDLMEDRRQDEIAARDKTSAAPLPVGRITSTTFLVNGAPVEGTPRSGDDLTFEMTVEHDTELVDWLMAVQITNTMGLMVYNTTTKLMGFRLPPLHESQTVGITLKDARFGSGKYFVSYSLMQFDGVHLHDLPQAHSFDIDNLPKRAVGTIYAEPVMATAAVPLEQ